jgi:hypothetical protein
MIASRKSGLSKVEADGTSIPRDRPTVAVVVTTFNHVHFLAEAVASVLASATRPADKIIV